MPFFARYFIEKGDTVRGFDSRKARRQSPRGVHVKSAASNSEAVRGCDLVLMAVPIESTLKVAEEAVPKMKRGSTLIDIMSVKGETLPALRKLAGERVSLLSIHPLFGPALESADGMKLAVIVKKEGGRPGTEASLAKRLFPGARIIPMTRKEHDQAMAAVLSLTHLLNLVYAGTMAKFLSPDEFDRISTPNSSMQMTLAEAILAQDPRLSFAIQASNGYTRKVGREALRELRRAIEVVEGSDWDAFRTEFGRLAKTYASGRKGKAAIREVYSAR